MNAPTSKQSILPSAMRLSVRRWRCSPTARACRTSSTGARGGNQQLSQRPTKVRSPEHEVRVQHRQSQPVLDAAGWKRGSDGIREKDGKKISSSYQTSINAPRQKEQAIFKQACQKAGIDLELKSVTASVFFSSDVADPDTYGSSHNIQMYTTTMTEPDAERFMDQYLTREISSKAIKWQGRNISPAGAARSTTRPIWRPIRDGPGQARRVVHQNERLGRAGHIIPLMAGPSSSGASAQLVTP